MASDSSVAAAEVRLSPAVVVPETGAGDIRPEGCNGAPARYSFIEASTKTGKTVGSIAWLFERAYLGERNQNRWWVAPVYGQAMIAFRRMKAGIP